MGGGTGILGQPFTRFHRLFPKTPSYFGPKPEALAPRPERGFVRMPVGGWATGRGLISAHGMKDGPIEEPDDEDLEIQIPLQIG